MAFGVDTTNITGLTASPPAVNPAVWSHTCGPNVTKLVVTAAVGSAGGPLPTGVTYNGVALTRVGTITDSGFEAAEIWRLNSPPTGSSLVIGVTYAGGPPQQFMGCSIGLNDTLSTEGTAGTATATVANPNTNVTSVVGDIVISALATDLGADGTTTEQGTLAREAEDQGAGDSDFSTQYQTAVGTTTSCKWTSVLVSAGGWVAVGVAFSAAVDSTPKPCSLGMFDIDWRTVGWF